MWCATVRPIYFCSNFANELRQPFFIVKLIYFNSYNDIKSGRNLFLDFFAYRIAICMKLWEILLKIKILLWNQEIWIHRENLLIDLYKKQKWRDIKINALSIVIIIIFHSYLKIKAWTKLLVTCLYYSIEMSDWIFLFTRDSNIYRIYVLGYIRTQKSQATDFCRG